MPLTLTDIGVVVPPGRLRLADWAAAIDARRSTGADAYRDVIDLMYAATGVNAYELAPAAATAEASFPCAGHETQAELALAATQRLEGDHAPELLLYAATSVDERIFRSSAAWLAGETRVSRVPHFGVGQLHGASLAGGLEIVAAMLASDGGDGNDGFSLLAADAAIPAPPERVALFVAAEKWPLPCPRQFIAGSVLGDAAVAIAVTTADEAGGLRVVAVANRSFAPFLDEAAAPGTIDAAALETAVAQTLAAMLAHIDTEHVRLMPSGLGHALDGRVAAACDVRSWNTNDGEAIAVDYGAAAMPIAVARAFEATRRGDIEDGALLLVWGASYAGAIGAVLVTAASGVA